MRGRDSSWNMISRELNVKGYQRCDGASQEREYSIGCESKVIDLESFAQDYIRWIACRQLQPGGGQPTKSSIDAALQLANSENSQATGLTSAALVK
jgi:hypothetical protein